jgi:serine phosphatase RsbU (regulator of sigma subunit)
MTRLNKATCESCPSNRFVTLFCAALDPASGGVAWASAGHNPPMLVRANGSTELLEGGGPPLGILRSACYHEYRARVGPGEMLVVYSDGVTEATNAAEEEFGEARLAEVLRANRARPAAEVVDAVRLAVTGFAGGAPVADDLTIVVARKTVAAPQPGTT